MDYQTANSQFETGSTVRSIISYSVESFCLLPDLEFTTLNMMMKMDSIAILKATGFSGNDVKWIFISLSIIIGLTGGVFGLVFGYVFLVCIDAIPLKRLL
jgi:lipoprotein-releasing system permease protein